MYKMKCFRHILDNLNYSALKKHFALLFHVTLGKYATIWYIIERNSFSLLNMCKSA